jgi:hypothetical protein
VNRHELPGTGCAAGSPGRSVLRRRRCLQVIENNRWLASLDYGEFARAVDHDGVFRGF